MNFSPISTASTATVLLTVNVNVNVVIARKVPEYIPSGKLAVAENDSFADEDKEDADVAAEEKADGKEAMKYAKIIKF